MREIRGKVDEDVVINDESELTGMITGNVRVTTGGVLVLRGMCCRDVIVETGARLIVRGTVSGAVINRGGEVTIFGAVGAVEGEAEIDPDARIDS